MNSSLTGLEWGARRPSFLRAGTTLANLYWHGTPTDNEVIAVAGYIRDGGACSVQLRQL